MLVPGFDIPFRKEIKEFPVVPYFFGVYGNPTLFGLNNSQRCDSLTHRIPKISVSLVLLYLIIITYQVFNEIQPFKIALKPDFVRGW